MAKHLFWITLSLVLVASCAGQKKVVRGSGALHNACAAGDLDKCHEQAVILEAGDANDRRAALTAFQFGCLLKHSASCNGLARMFGNEGGVSNASVLEALYAACDGGESEACVRLGDRAPRSRAISFYEKACDAKHGNGCHKLAGEMRRAWMIEENMVAALALDEKACDYGSADGCVSAGQAYLFGSGVEKDETKGLELLNSTCNEKETGGCSVLGVMYEKGIGVTPNTEQAAKYYDLAGPESELVADSPTSAYIVFVDACNRSNYLGCFDAAWFLEEGVEVERNITTSRELFEKACAGGIAAGCERAKKLAAPPTERASR